MMDESGLLRLNDYELTLALNKDSPENCLAFALILKFFQLENRYPKKFNELDSILLKQLSIQLEGEKCNVEKFDWEGRSARRFRDEIRSYLGYRKATAQDKKMLKEWLMKEKLNDAPSLEKTIVFTYEYFQEHKIEPISDKEIQRCVRSARDQFECQLFLNINTALSKNTRQYIKVLLDEAEADEEAQLSNLSETEEKITVNTEVKLRHLKKDIAAAALKNIEFELKKMDVIAQLELPHEFLARHADKLIKKYSRRILSEQPSLILRRPEKTCYAMMALFLHDRAECLFDNSADALIQLIHGMKTSSETTIKKTIVNEVAHVDGKFDILFKLADAAAKNPAGVIEDVIYPVISQKRLQELMTDLSQRGRWYQSQVHLKTHSLYAHGHRKVLLQLLEAFDFRANDTENKHLLSALEFIKKHKDLKKPYYPDSAYVPIENTFASSWKLLVVEQDSNDPDKTKIHRLRYEVAVLEKFGSSQLCVE